MVKALRLLAACGTLLLALTSCELLFMGPFPAAIGQATAKADLSSTIPASVASTFTLSSVSSFGAEYFVLFSTVGFDSTRAHLVIMDSHLKVLKTYTLDDIVALPNPGDPFAGSYTMTDYNGAIVIGNLWFAVLPSGVNFLFKSPPGGPRLDSPSVTGGPAFTYNEANFQIAGSLLQYSEYDSGWAPTSSFSATLGTPTPPPQSMLQLLNVFADPSSAILPDVFVFQDNGSNGGTTYFLWIPKPDIDGDLGTVALPDVFSHYTAPVVKYNLSRDTIGFSYAGVIAYDEQRNALVRFKLDSPDSVSSLSLKWFDGMKVATGIYGGYCVVWNPNTRVLTRYEQWWQ